MDRGKPNRRRRLRRALLAPLVAAVLLLAFAAAAQAKTIVVTTTADPTGANDCATTDVSCSLRQAVGAASSGDTIQLGSGYIQPHPGHRHRRHDLGHDRGRRSFEYVDRRLGEPRRNPITASPTRILSVDSAQVYDPGPHAHPRDRRERRGLPQRVRLDRRERRRRAVQQRRHGHPRPTSRSPTTLAARPLWAERSATRAVA